MARPLALAALLSALAAAGPAGARSFTWDAGVALGTVSFPAYRGASDRRQLTLPLPNVSIESRDFQLGRQGAQLSLNRSDTLRLRLSAGGSLPTDSDDLPIRAGMPDLLSSLEAGPALQWQLWSEGHWDVLPELLVRGVIATDLQHFEAIGWVTQPRLSLRWLKERGFEHGSDWKFSIGPVFADDRYHAYFYDVAPRYARPGRPAYDAPGGYGGWRAKTSLALIRQRLGLYFYLGYDNLERAGFRDSPLVQERHYWLAGVMLSWRVLGPRTVELE